MTAHRPVGHAQRTDGRVRTYAIGAQLEHPVLHAKRPRSTTELYVVHWAGSGALFLLCAARSAVALFYFHLIRRAPAQLSGTLQGAE